MRTFLCASAIAGGLSIVSAFAARQSTAQTPASAPAAVNSVVPVTTLQSPAVIYANPVSDPLGSGSGFTWAGNSGSAEAVARLREESQLDQQAGELAHKYGTTEDSAKKDEIKKQLADVLAKQFQLQQTRREEEVKEVEAKLKKLKDLIAKRNDSKSKIIDNRLDQLLRDAEGLGWNSGGNQVRSFSYGSAFAPSTRTVLAPAQKAGGSSVSSSASTGSKNR